jgi:hypothetical protein
MTDELRDKIISMFRLGADINEIAFDTGATKGDIRAVITQATTASMDLCRKRGMNTCFSLYGMHQTNRTARA